MLPFPCRGVVGKQAWLSWPPTRLGSVSSSRRLSSITNNRYLRESSKWAASSYRLYSNAATAAPGKLDFQQIDAKWRSQWNQWRKETDTAAEAPQGTGATSNEKPRKHRYVLPMFPYPSGSLHLGHLRVYTIADTVARFYQLQGERVLLPMGWDAFGLPAENAALAHGIPPDTWTRENIAKMKSQMEQMNGSWRWEAELATCDPSFYRHTQKLFLLLHERGLAYQAEAEVNFDPVDNTVVANEQVDARGCSWRSGARVEKRRLKQWFFKISAFREALLRDCDALAREHAWPDRVLAMQKHWLGKSTGASLHFPLLPLMSSTVSPSSSPSRQPETGQPLTLEVFTTRPDTLFGVQYLALAASHPLVRQQAEVDADLRDFLAKLPNLPADSKAGYQLQGVRAINPLAYDESTPPATKRSLPVYVAAYVLGDYGPGAVMGVPAHDARDFDFWQENAEEGQAEIRPVLRRVSPATKKGTQKGKGKGETSSVEPSSGETPPKVMVDHGVMTAACGPYEGRESGEAGSMLVSMLEKAKLAAPAERWRLRDWLISRQRYWGTPIPMVHCESGCGAVPVPDDQLPVRLPPVDNHWQSGRPGNPLTEAHDWVNTECPRCGGPAKRDTDTMDTFVDSSWYYMRYPDVHNQREPFSPDIVAEGRLPVDLYIGGIEHAILHLLYARFFYKFLATTDLFPPHLRADSPSESEVESTSSSPTSSSSSSSPTPIHEPFSRLITQGMVQGRTYTNPENGRILRPDELDLSRPDQPRIRATGAQPTVTYEKMSKSKHNGVDPTSFIHAHGADATRAHMLFQAPVADALNWDDAKISGVTRWLARVHEVVRREAAAAAGRTTANVSEGEHQTVYERFRARFDRVDAMSADELQQWDRDCALWRQVLDVIRSTTASYQDVYSLNTVVSDLMTLTNTLAEHAPSSAVSREAVSVLLRLAAPIVPAFAEECWALFAPPAHNDKTQSLFAPTSAIRFPRVADYDTPPPPTSSARQPPSLAVMLQPRTRPCSVSVQGKLRAVVQIPATPDAAVLQAQYPTDAPSTALEKWIVAELGKLDPSASKLTDEPQRARRTIVVRHGSGVNFVL